MSVKLMNATMEEYVPATWFVKMTALAKRVNRQFELAMMPHPSSPEQMTLTRFFALMKEVNAPYTTQCVFATDKRFSILSSLDELINSWQPYIVST